MITILIATSAFTQPTNNGYQEAMQESIALLSKTSEATALLDLANRFERIARAEKDEWLPWYYAAYATISASATSHNRDQKDQRLDIAQEYLDQALALQANESELVALQGYLYMIRVTVDPATRGQQLAPQATQTLVQATQMNPDNPRAYLLLGQMQYGTAQFFGADTAEACRLLQQAVSKYASASSEGSLMPTWGEKTARNAIQLCQQ